MARQRKWIVGNWKMNGLAADLVEARAIAAAAAGAAADIALCPPATLVMAMASACPGLTLGGQDCHASASGAYTGSISAPMLADAGARLVITGHSERRHGLGETSGEVAAKAAAALAAGLMPIICVGEAGDGTDRAACEAEVAVQLAASLPPGADPLAIAVAYEPVWAIGTGKTPTTGQIAAMHARLRQVLTDHYGAAAADIAILYGGSVTGANAGQLLSAGDVDGALVGGASLTAEKLLAIVAAVAAGPA